MIAGNEYNIVLTSSVPVSYKLIAKDANAPEEDFAEPDNDSDTEGDKQNKEDRHEQSGSGMPNNAALNTERNVGRAR